MFILSFFIKVECSLISDEKLVAAVAHVDGRGVHLIAVAYVDAVEAAAHQHRNRVCGAVRHAPVEHFLVVCIDQPARHVASPGHPVGAQQHRRMYCKKRIS